MTIKTRTLLLAGAALAAGPLLAQDAQPVTVGFLAKALDSSYWVTVSDGARAASTEDPAIEVVADAGQSEAAIEEQIQKVETMVTQGVDALAIAPTAPDQLIPALEAAIAAGIPVVLVDTDIPGLAGKTSYVGTDNANGGRMAAEYIIEQLPEGGQVALIGGTPGVTSTDSRVNGALAAFEGTAFEVVAQLNSPANGRDGGVTAMEDILTAHPEVVAVFASGDEVALGAAEAIRAAGMSFEDIVLVGFDASPNGIASVVAGEMDATVAQFPAKMGTMGVLTAAAAARGEEVPAVVDTGVEVVTAETAANFGG